MMNINVFIVISLTITNSASATKIIGEIDGTITLPCGQKKDILYQIRWMDEHDHTLIFKLLNQPEDGDKNFLKHAKLEASNGTLLVYNLTLGDEHKYKCFYKKNAIDHLQQMAEYDVAIHVPPEVIKMQANYDDGTLWIEEGQQANIICSVPKVKPEASIFWRLNGQLLHSQPETNSFPQADTTYKLTSTLLEIFNNVNKIKIQCFVATKKANDPLKVFTRIVKVYYSPKTIIPHGTPDNPPLENKDYAISCKIAKEGNPATITDYEWYHNGTKLAHQTSSTLTLRDLHRYDSSGRYQCAARNKAGMGRPGEELMLRVWYTPGVIVNLPSKPVIEYSNLTVNCYMERGFPNWLIGVKWYKNGVNMNTGSYDHVIGGTTYDPSITFIGVLYTDEGSYICQLQNEAGKVNSSVVDVTVYYPPVVLPAQIQQKGVAIGSPATIATQTRSNPPGHFYAWKFNGTDLRDGIEGKGTALITIDKVSRDDFGTYVCTVRNRIDGNNYSVEVAVDLFPQSSPFQPMKASAVSVTSQRIIVSWLTGFNGGFDQIFTLEVKVGNSKFRALASDIKDPRPDKNGTQVAYNFSGLQPDTEYEFRIKAINENTNLEARESRWVTIVSRTRVKPQTVISKLEVNYSNLTSAMVSYKVIAGSPSHLDLMLVYGKSPPSNDWKVFLPDLPIHKTSHTGLPKISVVSHKTYSFLIQASEGDDVTPINGDLLPWLIESSSSDTSNVLLSDSIMRWIIVMVIATVAAIATLTFAIIRKRQRATKNISGENVSAEQDVVDNSGYEDVEALDNVHTERAVVPTVINAPRNIQIEDNAPNTSTANEDINMQECPRVHGVVKRPHYYNITDDHNTSTAVTGTVAQVQIVPSLVHMPPLARRVIYYQIKDGKDVPETDTSDDEELSDHEHIPANQPSLSDSDFYQNNANDN